MKKSIYNQKWKVAKCNAENCWCRLIVLPSYDPKTSRLEDCVIDAGEVSAKLVKYIVKLHNDELKKKVENE